VAAVGVRLGEAPGPPSRGKVQIRIPSGPRISGRQRVALGDIHPSGDSRGLRAPSSKPSRTGCSATGETMAAGIAVYTTTGLVDQVGGDSGSRVAEGSRQSRRGDLASWKDPL
jgi:hypothetical protein